MACQWPRGAWANFKRRAKLLPRKHSGLAERATRKFAQRTAARRVELKMARRLRCVSLTGRKGHARVVAPWRRTIFSSIIGKSYRLHNTIVFRMRFPARWVGIAAALTAALLILSGPV